MSLRPSTVCRYIWRGTRNLVSWILYMMTMLCSFVVDAVNPATWKYPVRDRLARQILFAGVEAVPFTILIAAFAGVSIFLQTLFWLRFMDEPEFLYRMVSVLLIREAAPFMATFVVLIASASAITTEMATMKTSGQVQLLRAQGINVFQILAVPRMLGCGIAVTGLAIIFAVAALMAAAVSFLALTDQMRGTFFQGIINNVDGTDMIGLLAKSFLPGICMGAVCCYEGLRAGSAATEIPKAVSRAMLRSVTVAVLIWGLMAIAVYV